MGNRRTHKRRTQKKRTKRKIKSRTKSRNNRNCGGGDPLKEGLSVPKAYTPPALKTEPLTPSPREEEGSHSMMYTNQFVQFMDTYYPHATTGFIYEEPYYISSEPTKTTIKIYKKDIDNCAAMSIQYEGDIKEIVLDELDKCGEHSGTQILELVEHFARQYGYNTISLVDASNIVSDDPANCRIPLRFFMILATGQTWYNSKGYKSPYFDKEYEHNLRIIETPVLSYLRGILNEDEAEDIISRLTELNIMQIDETTTIKALFSTIKQEMRKSVLDCKTNPLHKWLHDILQKIALSGARIHSTKIDHLPENNIVFVWDKHLTKRIT
jgi:hypothetical protein